MNQKSVAEYQIEFRAAVPELALVPGDEILERTKALWPEMYAPGQMAKHLRSLLATEFDRSAQCYLEHAAELEVYHKRRSAAANDDDGAVPA